MTAAAGTMCCFLAAMAPALQVPPQPGVDLAARYPATLDASDPPIGRASACGPEDVWLLSGFGFRSTDFALEMGPSTVVLGRHTTNVLWAYVEGAAAGRLTTSHPGGGDAVQSVWLRFHPARVGELFPAATVQGKGPASRVTWGKRAAAWKMRACWHSGNQPVIPWRRSVTFDVETTAGRRRFYSVDTDAGRVEYEPAFEARALPALTPVRSDEALRAFDAAWEAFDREYAMFAIRPDVDWVKLREQYRPRAASAKTTYEVGAAIADMLAHLGDLHVGVSCGEEPLPGYVRSRPLNASPKAAGHLLGRITDSRKGASWARSEDGIAYLNIYALGEDALPGIVDDMLEMLGDSWALILDLRFNGGGNEVLGQQIAGRFVDRSCVYSRHRSRTGPEHSDLGPMRDRVVVPRGPWRWQSPVVVLIGQRTMSSAESFALMLAQAPQVVTLGDRTAGSSGRPRLLEPGLGLTIRMPTWVDYLPDGKALEAGGIEPALRVEAQEGALTEEADPVLEAALRHLRSQPAGDRRPARPP